ncbi:MAG: ABC transporter permease [Steroidobacteraceae bacterium]
MKYYPLVWSALVRKPSETLLTFLAITTAFSLLSVMVGMNLTVRQLAAHARMDRLWVSRRFYDDSSTQGLPTALRGRLARIEGVTGVGAVRWFSGYHADPHDPVDIVLMDEGMRQVWSEGSITPAQWDRLFSTPSGILVSVKAAAKWNLKTGDVFPVITQPGSRNDGGTSWDFQVLGIIQDIYNWSSGDGFIIGNSTYIENTAPPDQRGVEFAYQVSVKDAGRAMQISRQIDEQFVNSGNATLTLPKELNAQAQLSRGIDVESMTAAVAAAGIVMILFITGNAVARSVRERFPEYAILETIGFRFPTLLSLVFMEAVVPCLAGAAAGTALAAVLAGYATRFLPSSLAQSLSTPTPTLSVLGCAFGFAILLALFSCAIPMFKLRQLSVTDALSGR